MTRHRSKSQEGQVRSKTFFGDEPVYFAALAAGRVRWVRFPQAPRKPDTQKTFPVPLFLSRYGKAVRVWLPFFNKLLVTYGVSW